MFSWHGLLILVLDAVVIGVLAIRPWNRDYDDSDEGEGPLVILPSPLRPSYRRCFLFLAVAVVVTLFLEDLTTLKSKDLYQELVEHLLQAIVTNPVAVDHYASTIIPIFPVTVLGFGVGMAVAFHASLARRIIILLNAVLFLFISAVAAALLGGFGIMSGLPTGPLPVLNLLIQFFVSGIVVTRIAMTSFQFPRKTQIPLLRRGYWRDDVLTLFAVACSLAICIAAIMVLSKRFGDAPLFLALLAYSISPYFTAIVYIILGVQRKFAHLRKEPGAERPPIEVIIPAYNEEICIVELLDSLDLAAESYGGPVRVILCDDGSVDRTPELAREAMDNFRFAQGEIVPGLHEGKSGALNRALSMCRTDIVYRVDADCTVEKNCFRYSVPYFLADPRIGLVGALTLPKEPYSTWIDRMRVFEMTVGFGWRRPSFDLVDGVMCIPGTFTAFRREPAVAIGGFVEGMYGEDVDFTCQIARLGYRVVIDTRVRSYEDVPNTQRQLRTQRVRWNRGGASAYARHIPIYTGMAGPRMWFFYQRSSDGRFLGPLNLATFAYIITLCFLHPTEGVNIGRVLFLYWFRSLPSMIEIPICVIYYKKWKTLAWLPLQYWFLALKKYYKLEAYLSFNARPVITRSLRAAFGRPPSSGTPGSSSPPPPAPVAPATAEA